METRVENVPYLIDLGSTKAGIYLSQLQTDLLLLVSCKTKEELKDFLTDDKATNHKAICGQFPKLRREELSYITDKNLESVKREYFKKYQDSLITYLENDKLSLFDKVIIKLSKCGISQEDIEECLSFISLGDIEGAFIYIGNKYGKDMVDKINHYIVDDFENIKSVDYDTIEALHNHIVNDTDLDTIIIATGKYNNSMFVDTNGNTTFDPYHTNKALMYCNQNDKHMRYHALIDYAKITSYLKEGKDKRSKNKILSELKYYIEETFNYIKKHNFQLSDGTNCINVIEVFNELVEYLRPVSEQKEKYDMAWEKYFGITIEDLMSCFSTIEKPTGIEFMYNETMLNESPSRRAKVLEVFEQIQTINPNFIDIFGDQMHLNSGNVNTPDQIKNLSEVFGLLKKIQSQGKKVECTEFDFHINQDTIDKVNKYIEDNETRQKLATIKTKMIDNISRMAKKSGVTYERTTYWSLLDTVDHNLVRTNKKRQSEDKPLFSTMCAGLFGTGTSINKIASLIPGRITTSKSKSKKTTEDDEVLALTDKEQELYQTMKIEHQKKHQETLSSEQEKAKILALKSLDSEIYKPNGFVTFMIVMLIISLVIIGLLIVTLLLVWR